jgi:outer membrane protein assembly factor BamC
MFKYLVTTFIILMLHACSSVEELPIIDKVMQPDYVSSKKAKKIRNSS